MDKEYITRLLQRYFSNEATHAEREALFAELERYRNNEDWVDIHTQLLSQAEEIKDYNPERYQSIIERILAPKTKIIPIYRRRIFKWIAAACIILVTGYVLWVTMGRKSEVGSQKTEVAKTNDVPAPNNTRAVITLADGRKVYLDSVNNGTIAQENNVNVVKNANGEIIYSPDHQIAKSPDISYNTLFNPRGSKVISLTLSDGTKVWLNSESSLRYPASFAPTAVNREVEITGEAYFEVKHNSKQPFKVHLPNGSIVEDIGTSFNINSYPDENDIKTTLIEGAVRILSPAGGGDLRNTPNNKRPGVVLKPGQQAELTRNSQLITRNNIDIDEVLAWKNGYFQFNKAGLQQVLRQLTRWYDVDVVYETEPQPRQFVGEMERTLSLQQVLKILEKNGVHFRVEGKKIIVMK